MNPRSRVVLTASLAALLVALALPRVGHAQEATPPLSLEGTWHGDIETPAQEIGVVFHLKKGEGDTLEATLDVPAQGATGLPARIVQATADSLRLAVEAIGVVVEGRVVEGGMRIDATWQQGGGTYPLVLAKSETDEAATPEAPARDEAARQPGEPDVSGRWAGRLGPPVGLRVVFNIEEDAGGALTATAESPDQGGEPFSVSAVGLRGDTLRLEVAAVQATFEGRVRGDSIVEGTFRQRGQATPLTLRRGEVTALRRERQRTSAPGARRPQEPTPPFPYASEDVRFAGGMGEATLAGTLTLPEGHAEGGGPYPAVVLVSGSGPQDRNEEMMGHKPFLVLADYLTRRGVAVLRYDERGVAESGGNFSQATTHTFASDARAALSYLHGREDLHLGQTGIIGHSEGGLVGPMVAAHHPGEVDFAVLLAGPGVPGDEIIAEQVERAALAQGVTPAQAARSRATQERLLDAVIEAPDSTAAAERAQSILQEAGQSAEAARAGAAALTTPWYRAFIAHDPRPALREMNVPILALLGEKDTQVTPAQNAPALRDALAENADATVTVLPGLNHLFQTAETGGVDEYGEIEETFAPAALEAVGDWIAERTRAGQQ
jgi:pimeloyl-ACP methyl ester carboxylesterase